MKRVIAQATVLAAVLLAGNLSLHAQETDIDLLSRRLSALEADPAVSTFAAYERLQARQALAALTSARARDDRQAAQYVAERRVQIAEVAARAQAMQREIDRLDRERSDLLVEASRQDAARARAEAERLRIQAQVQAEEAERLRQQASVDAQAMQDVEAALVGVAGAQTAKLSAAREREAALARQEAELVAGGKLPAAKRDARGEVFTLAGDAFASGQATLTNGAASSVRTLAAYLQAGPSAAVLVEGHTDSQGAADANLKLSQRRADAVRDALVAAGVPRAKVQAAGRGATKPVSDNGTAAGRAKNRRVEIVISSK
ncbi:OmpA family protein [Lysobacter koreensis]|uniref:OmpA family protein n=1 Tax=Lysobacter koreensis TaxID=266122 RepID=A0ABW2YL40_9GAMM